MMIAMKLLALVLVLVLCATPAFGETWVKIFGCTMDTNVEVANGDDFFPAVAKMAQSATMVKICTAGSMTDCVTSKPETYPILNLRQGFGLLGHVDGHVPCDRSCVARYWTGEGDRLNSLVTRCAPNWESSPKIYHACGNQRGLHLSTSNFCSWALNKGARVAPGLDLYIDENTMSPTTSPVVSPTGFFQNPGHKTNIDEVQTRLTSLELSMNTMMSLVETMATKMDVANQFQMVNDEIENINEDTRVQIELSEKNFTQVTAIQAALQGLKQATTKEFWSSPPPTVTVESADRNLVLTAPVNIMLQSGTCGVDNLCEVSAFAARLATALDTLP